ncbi:Uncharacterized protein ChrSV_4992 [Chromobacterium vaccinii]|nr:Uncharacterized protein ChrSW_4986 [Chromobacterium vaccinii]QND92447.1 Uncharacterized protein ChrSV_4992 [Chromobacterium vaccinii]
MIYPDKLFKYLKVTTLKTNQAQIIFRRAPVNINKMAISFHAAPAAA